MRRESFSSRQTTSENYSNFIIMNAFKFTLLTLFFSFLIISCSEDIQEENFTEIDSTTAISEARANEGATCDQVNELIQEAQNRIFEAGEASGKLSKGEIASIVYDLRVEKGLAEKMDDEERQKFIEFKNGFHASGASDDLIRASVNNKLISGKFGQIMLQFNEEALASKDINQLEQVINKYIDGADNNRIKDHEKQALKASLNSALLLVCSQQNGRNVKILCEICDWVNTIVTIVQQVIIWVLDKVSRFLSWLGLDSWSQEVQTVIETVSEWSFECWWEECNEVGPCDDGVLEDCLPGWTFNGDTFQCEKFLPENTVFVAGCIQTLNADPNECDMEGGMMLGTSCFYECSADLPNDPQIAPSGPGERVMISYDPCRR